MKNIGNKIDWQAMVIVSILMLFGFFILYFTGFWNISNYQDFYNYLMIKGIELIFSVFFIFVGIYCWILFIRNIIIKPHQEILYLLEISNSICTFIDKKGKVFYFSNNNYHIDNFYEVIKTHNYIHKIVDISSMDYAIPRKKESYWLNFYSPVGNYENIFLLPIVYIILLPGIFIIILNNNLQKKLGIYLDCITSIYNYL